LRRMPSESEECEAMGGSRPWNPNAIRVSNLVLV
jgi:hypothetical protein